jgi:hypothetical protein
MCTFVFCFTAFFIHALPVIATDLPHSMHTECKSGLCLLNSQQTLIMNSLRLFTSKNFEEAKKFS